MRAVGMALGAGITSAPTSPLPQRRREPPNGRNRLQVGRVLLTSTLSHVVAAGNRETATYIFGLEINIGSPFSKLAGAGKVVSGVSG